MKILKKIKPIILISFSLIIFVFALSVRAEDNEWIELKPSRYGKQLIDLKSFKKLNSNQISFYSIYIPSNEISSGSNKEISYKMKVDCKRKLFIDEFVNGVKTYSDNWQSSHEDSLIEEVIDLACSK